MDASLGESPDGGTTELVVVPELDSVGLSRPHSVPLVKIVTAATQDQLNDVIDASPTRLGDVIDASPTRLGDVISTPGDVTIAEVALGDDARSAMVEEGHSCSSGGITTPVPASSSEDSKATPVFAIEPDWREAAQDPVLLVRCKKTTGELVKNRFGSGSRGKCIRVGKLWYTPTEFEAHCGRSASKDWKRSIRFQGQSLLTLIEEGYLQVHATSCSCGACLDGDAAAGAVRLHRPYRRKKRDKFMIDTEVAAKVLKRTLSDDPGSSTPTVTLPVSGLGELTVVPGIVLGGGTPTTAVPTTPQGATAAPSSAGSPCPVSLSNLPLDKAWDRMNEVLLGLERSVSGARALLEELKDRTEQETLELRRKLLQEKDEAVTQAKLEAQLSNMTKPSEGFLVQVRDDDGNQSLQPIMLDSLISNVPTLKPAPPINGVKKKCVNCNRESELECSGCHNRAYCSDFCQRRDWANHQGECGRTSPPPGDPLSTVTQVPGYIFMLSD